MFEETIPQDYGINESIALVTDVKAKGMESYRRIKQAFAQKMIHFQDVTLDDYASVTIMQEDNRYTFPFLIITDGLTREIYDAENALHWILEQKVAFPKYNNYMLYHIEIPKKSTKLRSFYSGKEKEFILNTDFVDKEEVKEKQLEKEEKSSIAIDDARDAAYMGYLKSIFEDDYSFE